MTEFDSLIQTILKTETIGALTDSQKPPVPQFDDNQNYIFISYSHKDYRSVYPDLFALSSAKVRYWYDKDLTPGHGWNEEAKERMADPNCAGVIFYLSENFVLSPSILEEVKFARESGKNYFAVSLSDELPEDLISISIGSKKRAELDALKIYDRRAHEDILLDAFPNVKTNIIKTDPASRDHIAALFTAIKRQFNVTGEEDTAKDDGQLKELRKRLDTAELYRLFPHKDGVLITYTGNEKTITLPEFITAIGKGAFENSELEEITLPNALHTIEERAFFGCKQLKCLHVATSLETIEASAFRHCEALGEIVLPPSLKRIGSYAFADCKALTKAILPDTVGEVGYAAFSGCVALEQATLGKALTMIPGYLFSECKALKTIDLPEGITTIGNYAFCACATLSEITLPDSVTSLGEGAFKFCRGLQKAFLGKVLQRIGSAAFYNCKNMTEVHLPQSLTAIGEKAFEYCTALEEIFYAGTRQSWEAIKKGDRWELYTPRYTVICATLS